RIIALGGRLQELERELEVTKNYLQATIEDKETANEELKSTNEELKSLNEELQNRMGELGQTNDDLHNVMVGLDSAVLIVGMDLRIRRYTATAERLISLVPEDVGRPISFIDGFCG